jgi:hypothetical protein
MSLDPVEQGLLNQPQRARCRRDTLARLNKPNRLLLELERYRARVALIIVIPLPDCQLRDTFGGGKINRLWKSWKAKYAFQLSHSHYDYEP